MWLHVWQSQNTSFVQKKNSLGERCSVMSILHCWFVINLNTRLYYNDAKNVKAKLWYTDEAQIRSKHGFIYFGPCAKHLIHPY